MPSGDALGDAHDLLRSPLVDELKGGRCKVILLRGGTPQAPDEERGRSIEDGTFCGSSRLV